MINSDRYQMVKTAVVAIFILTLTPAILFGHERTWPGRRLKQTYPEATHFTSQQATLNSSQIERIERNLRIRLTAEDRRPTFYPAYQGDQKVGIVIFVDETGQNGTIEIGVAFDNHGRVLSVKILEHRERSGIKKEEFLKQFIGKSSKEAVTLEETIATNPDALEASKAVIRGVKKALLLKQEVFGH